MQEARQQDSPFQVGDAAVAECRAGTVQDALALLIERMTRGERAALSDLYDATARRVFSVAMRILRDAPAAEEVVSDVYFQAWNQSGRYDASRGPVVTWLLVTCRSRALDALRQRSSHIVPSDDGGTPESADNTCGAEELLDAIQRSSMVHRALATMTPRQQHLLALSFFEGLSHAQIAKKEQMPLGTVKSEIRRTLRALRPLLEELR